MPISRFERLWQVRAVLAALDHERRGAGSQAHLDRIAAQEEIFRAELERMEREGEAEPPSPYVVRPEGATTWAPGR